MLLAAQWKMPNPDSQFFSVRKWSTDVHVEQRFENEPAPSSCRIRAYLYVFPYNLYPAGAVSTDARCNHNGLPRISNWMFALSNTGDECRSSNPSVKPAIVYQKSGSPSVRDLRHGELDQFNQLLLPLDSNVRKFSTPVAHRSKPEAS